MRRGKRDKDSQTALTPEYLSATGFDIGHSGPEKLKNIGYLLLAETAPLPTDA
jgi:hypothetical protein